MMTQIAALTDRAVLRIGGGEARPFLQGLLTNDVDALAPDKPLWAGLLSPQGKYLFDMILFDTGDTILADVPAARAPDLLKRLTMYKLRKDVTVAASDLKVFAAWDGESDAPYDPRLPGLGRRWMAESADTTATLADYIAHRLSLGVPDSDDYPVDRLMWLESNAVELNGVSFTKGCYVGQENTARMHHRDKLRKRLLPVLLTADPQEERSLRAGDREAGELISHHGGHGVALMRVEQAGEPLTLGGAAVTIEWPSWLGAGPRAE
ncbi:YgfZ/GcvT domain-containing protein [Sphingoaurantiacus capsulatus]|uniref:YgfZ/GcvT domain-containing protein n=1 Tax=Sphingoaurantiacus capsulatus TaxID=1771310 RepID=A0ABV7XBD9_9SPHN